MGRPRINENKADYHKTEIRVKRRNYAKKLKQSLNEKSRPPPKKETKRCVCKHAWEQRQRKQND